MKIVRSSPLWQYLSPSQRALAQDGEFLIEDSKVHCKIGPTDFSYMVFPYAKMYEGFLKQFLLDLEIISQKQYFSDHFRIGKVLSPNLAKRLGRNSAYQEISNKFGKGLADKLWHSWKEGRNLVFHYFPHNFRSLSNAKAISIIEGLVKSMTEAVRKANVKPRKRHEKIIFWGSSDAWQKHKKIKPILAQALTSKVS